MVIVGNDCTFMSGSFGVKEDDVYDAISKYARNLGLPRVYIASTSVRDRSTKSSSRTLRSPGTTIPTWVWASSTCT